MHTPLKEQRRTKDLEAHKKIIFDIQRYAADYGGRVAALWLER